MMALAVLVLLPVWYVGSYGTVEYLAGRGGVGLTPSLNSSVRGRLHSTVFVPIHLGAELGFQLCYDVQRFGRWCHVEGRGPHPAVHRGK